MQHKIEVVINQAWGGFGLSNKACDRLDELGCRPKVDYSDVEDPEGEDAMNRYTFYSQIPRDNPLLIQVLKELGNDANGESARLVIKETETDNGAYWIAEYDGQEQVFDYEPCDYDFEYGDLSCWERDYTQISNYSVSEIKPAEEEYEEGADVTAASASAGMKF